MKRERLAFVDHSYHRTTSSTQFLRRSLDRHFDVATFWDESWLPGKPEFDIGSVNASRPDYIVFFQLLPALHRLRHLSCRNITWIPMHDSIKYERRGWESLRGSNIKILHFSSSSYHFFSSMSFDGLNVRFFPEPRCISTQKESDSLSIFFWVRRKDISWGTLKSVLGDQRPRRIVMRFAPDPGHEPPPPSRNDIANYNIEIVEGWLEPERYTQLLQSCTLFMAPRRMEGIGMAALEAMASGIPVIAPDAPTMNEYIRHGWNGFLYDPSAPSPVDFSNISAVRDRLKRDFPTGHRKWVESEEDIIQFIRKRTEFGRSLKWRARRWLRAETRAYRP